MVATHTSLLSCSPSPLVPARRAPVLCYTPCSSPSKGMVGSGARSQIRRALLHACMHVHVSCLSWRAHWARAGPGCPPQRKALHVMTCMTHYHWASTRALDMRATMSLGARGRVAVAPVVGSSACFGPPRFVLVCLLPVCLPFFFSICLPACHAAVTLVTPVGHDSCGSPARLDLFHDTLPCS